MTDLRENPHIPLFIRSLTAVLVMAAVVLVILVVYNVHIDGVLKELKERYSRMERLRGQIIYYDEALTMSARMAVATGELQWEGRYRSFEPRMDIATKQIMDLSPEVYRQEASRRHPVHEDLFKAEHTAFELVREGRAEDAAKILFSKAYEEQKATYVRIIERLGLFTNMQVQEALEAQKSKEYLTAVSFITVLSLLLLAWLLLTRISRLGQDSLLENNRMLEGKVQERTDSLQKTLEHLQLTHDNLKTAQSQLLQSEKFSAIGQLAAGIAHEINNPMGFINSNLQTLTQYVGHYTKLFQMREQFDKTLRARDIDKAIEELGTIEMHKKEMNFKFINEDVPHLLHESQEGIDKIRKIVMDLRAFASPDNETVDAVKVEAIMESMLTLVHNEIKYKADLKKEYGPVPLIRCNPQKIAQVFVILLMNAAQAIKGRGIIGIKTYTRRGFVCIDVSDTGCGIKAQNMTKIFDPFFTTKPVGQGTGLGLSIAYDIVKKHGGTLGFYSTEGEGTTFTVKLPEGAEV